MGLGGSFKRMKAKKKIVTKDKKEFLDSELAGAFKNIFRGDQARQLFENTMADKIKTCDQCGTLYWTGCSKRCDCDYELLKNDNKNK